MQAIFISWSIALPEYSLQVPANRIAHTSNGGPFSAPQLKVIAEVCSLTTFFVFSALVLKERLRWVDLGSFALILSGVLLSLLTKKATAGLPTATPPLLAPAAAPVPSQQPSGGRQLMLELPKAEGGHHVSVLAGGPAETGGAPPSALPPVPEAGSAAEQPSGNGVYSAADGERPGLRDHGVDHSDDEGSSLAAA